MTQAPRPAAAEDVAVDGLHPRLRQLGAEYQPDRSTNKSHIYYSRPTRRWLRVIMPRTGVCRIEHWVECPCAYLEVLERSG